MYLNRLPSDFLLEFFADCSRNFYSNCKKKLYILWRNFFERIFGVVSGMISEGEKILSSNVKEIWSDNVATISLKSVNSYFLFVSSFCKKYELYIKLFKKGHFWRKSWENRENNQWMNSRRNGSFFGKKLERICWQEILKISLENFLR